MNTQSNNSYKTPIERVQEKWGSAIDKGKTGFQIVPDVLIRNQRNLKIDATDTVILLNILMYWWTKDNLPRPKLNVIANRMGISRRTVERHVEKLESLKLIKRLSADKPNSSTGGKRFDVSGLVSQLQKQADRMREIEKDYAQKKEQG